MITRRRWFLPQTVVASISAIALAMSLMIVPAQGSDKPTNSGTTLLVLGDSLTWGANYFTRTQSRLASSGLFASIRVDARWGRRISGPTSSRYSGSVAYRELVKSGVAPTAVIVALGSNDVAILVKRREYIAAIQDLMKAIGNVPVVWVNVYRTDSTTTARNSQRLNAVLVDVLTNYPRASIYDWSNLARTTAGLTDPDKIHLTPLGHEVRTKVYLELAATLAQRASDMTTTTTVAPTTVPTTVAPTTVPPTTVPPATTLAP